MSDSGKTANLPWRVRPHPFYMGQYCLCRADGNGSIEHFFNRVGSAPSIQAYSSRVDAHVEAVRMQGIDVGVVKIVESSDKVYLWDEHDAPLMEVFGESVDRARALAAQIVVALERAREQKKAPAERATAQGKGLILPQDRAQAIYSAMCQLNGVGMRLDADNGDMRVWEDADGVVRVAHYDTEVYANQAEFAAAYGLHRAVEKPGHSSVKVALNVFDAEGVVVDSAPVELSGDQISDVFDHVVQLVLKRRAAQRSSGDLESILDELEEAVDASGVLDIQDQGHEALHRGEGDRRM